MRMGPNVIPVIICNMFWHCDFLDCSVSSNLKNSNSENFLTFILCQYYLVGDIPNCGVKIGTD